MIDTGASDSPSKPLEDKTQGKRGDNEVSGIKNTSACSTKEEHANVSFRTPITGIRKKRVNKMVVIVQVEGGV